MSGRALFLCPDAASASELQRRLDAIKPNKGEAVQYDGVKQLVPIFVRDDPQNLDAWDSAHTICLHPNLFKQQGEIVVRDEDVLNWADVSALVGDMLADNLEEDYGDFISFQLSVEPVQKLHLTRDAIPDFFRRAFALDVDSHQATVSPFLSVSFFGALLNDWLKKHSYFQSVDKYKLSVASADRLLQHLMKQTKDWPLGTSMLFCTDGECGHPSDQEAIGKEGRCRYILAEKNGRRGFFHDHRAAEQIDTAPFDIQLSPGRFSVPRFGAISDAALSYKELAKNKRQKMSA